ncbi:MAG: valyl-tRNA synthetase [Chloroflexi bacterium OLB14]|nr:MAG: valyl-tRNA synthetase [Chloroflexi bacterium OLB14]
MTKKELPKAYDFKSTEARIYAMWEAGGFFKPHNDPNNANFDPNVKPFVIAIPPPNVTGELHIGHAMFVSVEDLMIRYHRMKGYSALWIPGTDHAGIATQLMVERDLLKNEEVTREELGREEFEKRTWEWKRKYGNIITTQIRRLGASCDWDRERFTLDDGLSTAVREAFVRLYEKGLIYRGPRLINWSPGLKTAVSDLEVEYSEEDVQLYYFKYKLKDSDEFIPVATIRPETILGDTAVAVHPEDERYKKYIGKTVIVPILNREIPVIGDDYVSMEFGTGALKITPGHDPNDYAIAQRHNLPIISVLDVEAKINANGGKYQLQDRYEARKNLWSDMKDANLTIKTENYRTTIPRSQRGGEIVEPMISEQWFVKMESLANAGLEAVRNEKIKIVPERFEKTYFNWLENIKDWCISRQLWWGHRIPVWYCKENHMTVAREDPTQCATCGSKEIRQDDDVLDTWFSSGLWPFSTLGWPQQTADLKYFYPTSYMETGYDIIFFWVARMIMMGLEFTNEAPFHTVYLHGLVRDEQGRKMSKTTGNVIDPLIVMDEFGTDALRFTLLVGSTPGNDTNVGVKKVESNRNFANKIWNAGRFVINAIESLEVNKETSTQVTRNAQPVSLADQWIQAKLNKLIRNVERQFQNFQYGQAGAEIYEFIWSDFADWYVEIAKGQMQNAESKMQTVEMLAKVFDTCLRLLHPFTPFVTEEVWGHLHSALRESSLSNLCKDWTQVLIVAKFPEPTDEESWEAKSIADFELIQEVIRSIRNLRAEKGIAPSKKIPATISAGDKLDLISNQISVIASLSGLDQSQVTSLKSLAEKPSDSTALIVGSIEIYLPLAGMVDVANEKARLEKELKEAESHITRLENLLNGDFANKAPAALVQKEKDKLAGYKDTAEKIKAQLK